MVGKKALIFTILMIALNAKACALDFHVSVLNDKLHPGDDTTLTILIENGGSLDNFPVNEDFLKLMQIVTTAKNLRVELGDCRYLKVLTLNPQLIGDLPSGRVAKAVFRVKVDENAKTGEYEIPVKLKYTEINYILENSNAVLRYREKSDVEFVKVEIAKRDYDFSVKLLNSKLRTNQEGVIDLEIKNIGKNKICNATLLINATPPIIPNPKATFAYIGDLDADCKVNASFKVYVMDGALNQTYPATLVLRFKTTAGYPMILTKSIGLDVKRVESFQILETQSFVTEAKVIPMFQQTSYSKLPSFQMDLINTVKTSIPNSAKESLTKVPSRGFVRVTVKNVGEDISDAIAILTFDNPLLQAENSYYIGNFKSGEKRTALFYVKSFASAGNYTANVVLKYKNKYGDEEISKKYRVVVEVATAKLKIDKVETENLAVGLKGSLNVLLKNNVANISDATFTLIPSSQSIIPISSSYYVSNIAKGKDCELKFRLKVSDEAVSGYYRLFVIARYTMGDAKDLLSILELPVFVNSKSAMFEVVSIESNLHPDETGDVKIKIRNAGITVYNTVVKLELSAPLTIAGGSSLSSLVGKSQPGLYFIGTLKPNETAIAKFRIDVDKDAGAGSYPVTIVIEYYDSEGYMHTSNPIVASVEVKEKPLITPTIAVAIFLALIALVIAARFAKKRVKREGGK